MAQTGSHNRALFPQGQQVGRHEYYLEPRAEGTNKNQVLFPSRPAPFKEHPSPWIECCACLCDHTGLLPSYWSAMLYCPACNKKPCSSAATATCNNPLCWLRCLSTHQCSGQVPIRCSKMLGCCKAQPKTSMACPVNAWALQCSGGRTSKRSAGDTEKGSGPALDAMAAATPVRNTPAPTTMSQLQAAAADCCWQSCLARLS